MLKVKNRLIGIFLLVLALNLAMASFGFGQQYTVVADLFYESYVNAESFDAYVSRNRALFDDDFHSCLNALYDHYFPIGAAHARQCSNMAGYGQDYLQCIQSNTAAGIVVWIDNIRMLLQGRVTWRETMVGGSVITAFTMMRALGDPSTLNMVIEIQRNYVRQMAPALYCTRR